jgi:hypothetical protein
VVSGKFVEGVGMELTNEQVANRHQIHTFLAGLCSEYRLFIIRAKRKAFNDYDNFFSDIVEEPFALAENKKQIKLGLVYSAVAETIQYAEDLFSLSFAAKEKDNMIKNLVNYKANVIKPYVESFLTMTTNDIMTEMHIPDVPTNETWPSEEAKSLYIDSLALIQENIKKIVAFYKRFYRFYLQYKHGLKVPLNYMGNREQVDINDSFLPLSYYETKTVEKVWTDGQVKAFMIPNFSPNLHGVKQLYESENLLRYEYDSTTFDEIENVTYKIWQLLNCLQSNLYADTSLEKKEFIEIRFPTNKKSQPLVTIGFELAE